MNDFNVALKVVSERHCPYYSAGDLFLLTSQTVQVPIGYPSCLILVREVTNLLFSTLVPAANGGFEELKNESYSCGGCTGLIKFQIEEKPEEILPEGDLFTGSEAYNGKEGAGGAGTKGGVAAGVAVSGQLSEILPSELLQFFHMHQKTGKLMLEVSSGTGRIAFREGAIIGAKFLTYENKDAVFALLRERQGRFSFFNGIPSSLLEVEDIGDFMMLLMEGIKRMDEDG